MSDVVKRLRGRSEGYYYGPALDDLAPLMKDGADEIERLRAIRDELLAALEWIAEDEGEHTRAGQCAHAAIKGDIVYARMLRKIDTLRAQRDELVAMLERVSHLNGFRELNDILPAVRALLVKNGTTDQKVIQMHRDE